MQYYELSADNTITNVDNQWDEKILGNNNACVSTAQIIGKPIDEFITGDVTQTVMAAAFQYVRYTQKTLVKQYRCDDAFHKRHYDMIITPIDNLGLRVSHKLVKLEARNSKVKRNKGSLPTITSCSICRKYWWQDNWLDAEDLSILLSLSIETLYSIEQFTVCECCQQQYKSSETVTQSCPFNTLPLSNSCIGSGLAK